MPYAPGNTYDNSGLARGILTSAQGIAAGLERYHEEKKRVIDNSKFADGLFKTNPELQKRVGLTEDAFKALAARDRIEMMRAAIAGVHNDSEMAKTKAAEQAMQQSAAMHPLQMANEQARTQALQQTIAYHQQLDAQNTALKGFAQEFANGPQAFNLQDSAPGNEGDILKQYAPAGPQERMLGALQRYPGAAASPQFDNTATALQRFYPQGKVKNNPAVGTVTTIPGVGSVVGLGEENPPHFAPVHFTKEEAEVADLYPWTLSHDEEEITAGLAKITDPKELARALKVVTMVKHSRADDPLGETYRLVAKARLDREKRAEEREQKARTSPGLLGRASRYLFGGDQVPPTTGPAATQAQPPPPAAAAPAKAPARGSRVKQNGAIFEWDGTKYVPVKAQ